MKEPPKECFICHRGFTFIRAQVTLQNPRREICLECGRIEELSQRKQKTSEEV